MKTYDVTLSFSGDIAKISAIKAVRAAIDRLGLKEAKDLVESGGYASARCMFRANANQVADLLAHICVEGKRAVGEGRGYGVQILHVETVNEIKNDYSNW